MDSVDSNGSAEQAPREGLPGYLDRVQVLKEHLEAGDNLVVPLRDPSERPRQGAKLRELLGQSETRIAAVTGPLQRSLDDLRCRSDALREVRRGLDALAEPERSETLSWLREQRRILAQDREGFVIELESRLAECEHDPRDLLPGNPVRFVSTEGRPADELGVLFEPDRLYLDVTDADLAAVKEAWPVVEERQALLRRQGLSDKRSRGGQPGPRDPAVTRWVERSREIGEAAARSEFRAETDNGDRRWLERADWWRRNVRKHLR